MATAYVLVGIDAVADPVFDRLQGCIRDTSRVEEMCRRYMEPGDHLTRIVEADATRGEILTQIRSLRFHRVEQVLFYFAGHGVTMRDHAYGWRSVLVTADTTAANPLVTGLTNDDLLAAILSLNAARVRILIDACQFRPVGPRLTLVEPDELDKFDKGSFLAMVAANRDVAIELPGIGGEFTSGVIEALATTPDASIAHFADEVTRHCRQAGAVIPSTVVAGDASDRFLFSDGMRREPLRTPEYPDLHWEPLLEEYQQHSRIWLMGASGAGKTIALMKWVRRRAGRFYSTVPNAVFANGFELEDLVADVARQVAEASADAFPDGRVPGEAMADSLRRFAEMLPECCLVIDHLDRLLDRQEEFVLLILAEWAPPLIVVSQAEPPDAVSGIFTVFVADEITVDDARRLAERVGTQRLPAETLISLGVKTALELRALLAQTGEKMINMLRDLLERENLTDTAAAAAAAGGVYNLERLAGSVGLPVAGFKRLFEFGLLVETGSGFEPHDSLVKASPADLERMGAACTRYLSMEIEASPQSRPLLAPLLAARLQGEHRQFVSEQGASTCLAYFWQVRHYSIVRQLTEELAGLSDHLLVSAVFGLELLVRSINRKAVEHVLGRLDLAALSDVVRLRVLLVRAELSWWLGSFTEAIHFAELVLSARSPNADLRQLAYLNRGIARFFLGEWNKALDDLAQADAGDVTDLRTRGWSRLIQATVLGIRGVDPVGATELFQSAARLLRRVDDQIGLAVCLGNSGEVAWKSGALVASYRQLSEALGIASTVCDVQQQLEIRRNILSCSVRYFGPNSSEVDNRLDEIKDALRTEHELGTMLLMQLYNTLATAYLLRDDTRRASAYLTKAAALTHGNREYDIYTLGNRALQAAIGGRSSEAMSSLKSCFDLCAAGGNHLARAEVEQNLRMASELIPPSTLSELRSLGHFDQGVAS